LGKDLSFLFHQEKEIDMALVSYRRRRALHEIEIQLLMALFSRFPKHYKGELKEHWDKTIKKQYQAAWPNLKLRDFLIENPQFDASQKIVLGVRCETCLLECKKINTQYYDMDVHTPNELDIRPYRNDNYQCTKCEKRQVIRVEM
jgi:hypothetical protein